MVVQVDGRFLRLQLLAVREGLRGRHARMERGGADGNKTTC